MTHHDPTHDQDGAQPVPAGAPAGAGRPYPGHQPQQAPWTQGAPAGQPSSTHRYGDPAGYDTARYDPQGWGGAHGAPGGPPYFGGPVPQNSPAAGPGRRTPVGGGLLAAVLAGALVLGGAAGFGGAAAYDLFSGD